MILRIVQFALAKGLPGGANFALIALLARTLSAEQYGSYALVVAMASMASAALGQWLMLSVMRYQARYHNDPSFKATITILYLLITILGGIILFPSVYYWTDKTLLSAFAAVAFFTGLTAFGIDNQLVISQQNPKAFGFNNATNALVALVSTVLLMYLWRETAEAPLLGQSLGFFSALLLWSSRRWLSVRLNNFSWAHAKRCASFGIPLTITFVMTHIVSSSDRFFLAIYHGAAETGIYSAPYDITQRSLGIVMIILNMALYPAMISTHDSKPEQFRTAYIKNLKLFLGIAIITTVVMILAADFVAQVFVPNINQEHSARLIRIISISTLYNGILSYQIYTLFQMKERPKNQVVCTLIAASLNILLNFLLIPAYGAIGAAVSSACAYLGALIYGASLAYRYITAA